jgi:DNA polymerase-1
LNKAKEDGYAQTLFGRRRSASGLNSSNVAYRNATIREITNFPIQGSAADLMKLAMMKVDKIIQDEFRQNASMILQIHDELIFEYCRKRELEKFVKKVKDVMENIYPLNVPLKVEVMEGKNLEEVH